MRVVVAPDSWSGFASAPAVSRTQAMVLREAGLAVRQVPMADGGEGTTLVLMGAGARPLAGVLVRGPDGERVRAPVCDLDGVTFLESARVLGLGVVGPASPPLSRSSFGLGEALSLATVNREGPLVVGLGGSATLDGGLGLAQALGLRLEDAQGRTLDGVADAHLLGHVAALRGDPPLAFQVVQAWADVTATLAECAALFGPQKGATAAQIPSLTSGLARWGEVLNTWRQGLGQREVPTAAPGGGAAGGLGFALMALLDARLVPGSRAVARAVGLPAKLAGADAVVTGEGRYDPTSLRGKVVGEVVRAARAAGVATIGVLAGQQTGTPEGAPVGPDWVQVCKAGPAEGRQERLEQAAREVAGRLLPG